MKKVGAFFLMGILFLSTLVSCTQEDDLDELFINVETQQCCEGGELDPPPPPPPPGDDNSGG
jgi:hypothetical protein